MTRYLNDVPTDSSGSLKAPEHQRSSRSCSSIRIRRRRAADAFRSQQPGHHRRAVANSRASIVSEDPPDAGVARPHLERHARGKQRQRQRVDRLARRAASDKRDRGHSSTAARPGSRSVSESPSVRPRRDRRPKRGAQHPRPSAQQAATRRPRRPTREGRRHSPAGRPGKARSPR